MKIELLDDGVMHITVEGSIFSLSIHLSDVIDIRKDGKRIILKRASDDVTIEYSPGITLNDVPVRSIKSLSNAIEAVWTNAKKLSIGNATISVDAVGVKNSSDERVNPATQETLANILTKFTDGLQKVMAMGFDGAAQRQLSLNAAGELVAENKFEMVLSDLLYSTKAPGAVTVGDIVCGKFSFANAVKTPGAKGMIMTIRAVAYCKTAGDAAFVTIDPTNWKIRLHLYHADPTGSYVDDAVYSYSYANAFSRIGYADITFQKTQAGTSEVVMGIVEQFNRPINPIMTTIYAVPEWLGAATIPANTAKMYMMFELMGLKF